MKTCLYFIVFLKIASLIITNDLKIIIQWYKYPLRGAMCNIEITDSQFVDILNDCINSLQTNEKVRIFYEVDDWWLPKEERKYAFSQYE